MTIHDPDLLDALERLLSEHWQGRVPATRAADNGYTQTGENPHL